MSSMAKPSPGDLSLRGARLALVEDLDHELALLGLQRPLLGSVGSLEHRRRQSLHRLRARRDVRRSVARSCRAAGSPGTGSAPDASSGRVVHDPLRAFAPRIGRSTDGVTGSSGWSADCDSPTGSSVAGKKSSERKPITGPTPEGPTAKLPIRPESSLSATRAGRSVEASRFRLPTSLSVHRSQYRAAEC